MQRTNFPLGINKSVYSILCRAGIPGRIQTKNSTWSTRLGVGGWARGQQTHPVTRHTVTETSTNTTTTDLAVDSSQPIGSMTVIFHSTNIYTYIYIHTHIYTYIYIYRQTYHAAAGQLEPTEELTPAANR